MVQLMNSGAENGLKTGKLKLEGKDCLGDQFGPLRKRSKPDPSLEKCTSETSALPNPPSLYSPLDEPSPLDLSLRKSPSLLDLIQMKLFQENSSKLSTLSSKKDHKGTTVFTTDKLKASNFPALILKIGTWEYKSRYEGDLVGKCYFAKHKLVWEVLDGSLKNKIEIQWSDIVALNVNYTDAGIGTLNVVLARPPLFFRETNPQPRKHTLWQATADFTGGQASIHRQHFLQCSQASLSKHFEKLIQCDPRLNFLSQQPVTVLKFPYFKSNDQNESSHGIELKSEEGPAFFSLGDMAASSVVQSPTSNKERNFFDSGSENCSAQYALTSSAYAIEENSSGSETSNMLRKQERIRVPGLHPSMSMSDLVNHIGYCISQQNPISGDDQQSRDILDEITQYLFTDSQLASVSDEQSLMSRVNSLCCLLQMDPSMSQSLQPKNDNALDAGNGVNIGETHPISESSRQTKDEESSKLGKLNDISGSKEVAAISRKDSIGELLLHLPRIPSLPQFMYNLTDDHISRAR